MDDMVIVLDCPLLISRWIHILAMATSIGGVAFMRFGLIPAANESLADEDHSKLRENLTRRWGKFVHGSIGLLLITGFYNFYALAIKPGVDPVYHGVFGPKLLLAFAVFFIATALVGRSSAFASMKKARKKWSSVLLILAALIILLSGILNQIRSSAVSRDNAESAKSTDQRETSIVGWNESGITG